MMKVYDCIVFWIENDLLEIRLNQHWDKVDKFIIVEAGETHTGLKKPFNFDQERFKPYMEKIVYRTFDSFDQAMKDYPHLVDQHLLSDRGPNKASMDWSRDHFQANFIVEVLKEIGAEDTDIVYVSCCDEILRHSSFDFVKQMLSNAAIQNPPVLMFKYWLYAYKFNLLNKDWQESDSSGMASLFSTYKKTLPATLRDQRICTHLVPDAGWHFTFMDGKNGEDILAKQRAWAHSRDVIPGQQTKFDNQTTHEALVRLFEDYALRKVPMEGNSHPQYLLDNLEKFDNYIFDEEL
jgi:beta-1,4-mannosyl-glycoprotein beta-1,4-N-acetylglucosaminyltransferase